MRARELILGFAAAAAIIIGAVGAGCGGSSDVVTPDASADVTVDHAVVPDTGPDVVDAAPVCAVDADLTTFMPGGDAGACIACVQSKCSTVIARCNMDCDCKSAFIDFYNCTGMGGTLINCAISTLAGIDQSYQNDFTACAPPCASICGVSLDGGRDGGRDGASDAASDAPGDAPGDGG